MSYCLQSCPNCQDRYRYCRLLHIWTAVLCVRRDYVEQHQGQVHQAPRPRRLHHEDHHGYCLRASRRGCSHHRTFHGRHWRFLLLNPRTNCTRLHRSHHLLGHRFRTWQIPDLEKRCSTNLWSFCSRVRH